MTTMLHTAVCRVDALGFAVSPAMQSQGPLHNAPDNHMLRLGVLAPGSGYA